MIDIHWIRPQWFWLMVPTTLIFLLFLMRKRRQYSWQRVCDPHLLPHLIANKGGAKRAFPSLWLWLAGMVLMTGLAGPSLEKLPVPSFQQIRPQVMLLSMDDNMNEADVSPSRLERAKFIIQDILSQKGAGQFALIAYTSEPFVVSPLTEDGNTITSLLSSLDTSIMPVTGNQLSMALEEAQKLIRQAGYQQGNLLVLSASAPDQSAEEQAAVLANQGLSVSIMPILPAGYDAQAFQNFSSAGNGLTLAYETPDQSIQQWLQLKQQQRLDKNELNNIPLWKDQGRWLVLIAALMLLPVFRKGWLERMTL